MQIQGPPSSPDRAALNSAASAGRTDGTTATAAPTHDRAATRAHGDSAPVASASVPTAGQIAGTAAPVDMERVAAVRAAIADGTFRVDADAIAHALMKGERT